MKNFRQMICVLLSLVMACSVLTACGKTMEYTGVKLADGKIGVVYSQSVAVADGPESASYKLKEGNNLPGGLSLSTEGTVKGTPSEIAEEHKFTVVATASGFKSAEAEFSITIGEGVITYGSGTAVVLGAAKVGNAYTASVAGATADGTPAIAYALKSGSQLPTGLSLSGAGQISGTPTVAMTSTFAVTASADKYKSVDANFTIVVSPPSFTYIGGALTAAEQGITYSASVATAVPSYGAPTISYNMTGGSLPGGLLFNTATGAITGVPNAAGSYTFTVTATAPGYTPVAAEFTLSVSVLSISYADAVLASAKTGIAYNGTVATATVPKGSAEITYALKSGSSLPAGLSLAAEGTGAITGVPTAVVANHTFTVIASAANYTSAEATFTLSVSMLGISYSDTVLAAGKAGAAYSASAAIATLPEGGSSAITYTVTSGLAAFNAAGFTFNNGSIGGVPIAAGEFIITVTASAQYYTSASATFTITVAPAIYYVGYNLSAKVGETYSGSVAGAEVKGLVAPPSVTYTLKTGVMPAGLVFDNGAITGIPEAATSPLSFTVTANASGCEPVDAVFTIEITSLNTINYLGRTLVPAQLAVAYSDSVATASGVGNPTFKYEITAGLAAFTAAGFTMSEEGLVSGTPAGAAGTLNFTVTASALGGGYAPTAASFSIVIGYRGTLSYTGGTLAQGRIGDEYAGSVASASASAHNPVITYILTGGSLPLGLILHESGTIGGVPEQSGEFGITVTAGATGFESVSAYFTIVINNRGTISITTAALPDAPITTPYSTTIAASASADNPQIAYTVSAGLAAFTEAGFALNAATGEITGTPAGAPRTVTFTITAAAAGYTPASKQFSIVITNLGNIVYAGATLAKGEQDQPYNVTVATASGAPSITYAVTDGSLPAGLTLGADGTIIGTPTLMGMYYFVVTASAVNYTSASAQFILEIEPPTISVPQEYVFEAEHVDLTGITSQGWSGSASELGLVAYDGDNTGASNKFFITPLFSEGVTLTFNITSDKAVNNAKVIVRLSAEGGVDFFIDPTLYTVSVNGVPLNYGTIVFEDVPALGLPVLPFEDYLIAENVSLNAGLNVIKLITSNSISLGGTTAATAPIVDCVKIITTATLSWNPKTSNTDGF